MKRSWVVFGVTAKRLALAFALVAIIGVAGCNDYGNTFQSNTGAQITILSPSNIAAGGQDLTVTVTSTGGFVAATKVQWNGQNLVTTYVSATTVTAVVPAAFTAKPGTAYVNTLNPASGKQYNGLSNSLAFLIVGPPNPVPTITPPVTFSPASITACGTSCGNASVKVTIQGTNFLPVATNGGSQVQWTFGTPPVTYGLTTTVQSSTQITATLGASLLSTAGTGTITVFNPSSDPLCLVNCPPGGGGSSNSVTFTISPAAAAAAAPAAQNAVEETPAVSHDARFVAYTALQNDHTQVFLRDTCLAAASDCQPHTTLLSAAPDGAAGDSDSHSPSMSSDGRFIAFSSAATNLISAAPAGRQVYLHDTCLGAAAGCTPSLQLVSTDPNGALVGSESILPSVSASGRFVAFLAVTPSHSANHPAAPSKSAGNSPNSGYRQVFVRDTCLGAANCTPKTTRISLQPGDTSSPDATPAGPALSAGAKRVALADGRSATLFTHAVPVDDRVFLALTSEQH